MCESRKANISSSEHTVLPEAGQGLPSAWCSGVGGARRVVLVTGLETPAAEVATTEPWGQVSRTLSHLSST